MPKNLAYYLRKIERLRIDRSHCRPAPHKPLLILTILDLFEEGLLNNEIEPSPRFVETFLKFWHLVSDEPPRIFLPYFHLRSDGFWKLHAKTGKEEILENTKQMNSMAHLTSIVAFASVEEEFFILLQKAETREVIRQKVLETYFPKKTKKFRSVFAENKEINNIENLLIESAEKEDSEISKEIIDTPKRSIAFRRVIIRLYNYTCAACRYRIITNNGETTVEAAHIYPFAQSYDDSIGNGLSLCPLHHWFFDKGLFTIDDSYKIVVSANFEESGNEEFFLRNLERKEIQFPKEKPFRPSLTMIRWHRENVFQLS